MSVALQKRYLGYALLPYSIQKTTAQKNISRAISRNEKFSSLCILQIETQIVTPSVPVLKVDFEYYSKFKDPDTPINEPASSQYLFEFFTKCAKDTDGIGAPQKIQIDFRNTVVQILLYSEEVRAISGTMVAIPSQGFLPLPTEAPTLKNVQQVLSERCDQYQTIPRIEVPYFKEALYRPKDHKNLFVTSEEMIRLKEKGLSCGDRYQ